MPRPPESASRYASIVRRFAKMRIGVVGDFLADRYVQTSPARLSREAPVVILRYEGETLGPGGAANSAANLLALGARVALVGVLGGDGPGQELRGRFVRAGADAGALLLDARWRTPLKTRILAGDRHRNKQQVLRVDREPDGSPPPSALRRLEAAARRLAPRVDGWLVSDYGYGTVTPRLYEALRADRGGAGRVVVVDSRRRGTEFAGATALTPNEEEAAAFSGMPLATTADVAAAGAAILARTGAANVVVTRGNQGLALFSAGERPAFVAASGGTREVTDANGAGDTVAATLALALAAGARPIDAARLANHAGGVVVMKPGAATLTPTELLRQARAFGGRRGAR